MLDFGKASKVLMAMVGIILVVLYFIQQEILVYFPTELLNIITSYLLRTEKLPVAAFLKLL